MFLNLTLFRLGFGLGLVAETQIDPPPLAVRNAIAVTLGSLVVHEINVMYILLVMSIVIISYL